MGGPPQGVLPHGPVLGAGAVIICFPIFTLSSQSSPLEILLGLARFVLTIPRPVGTWIGVTYVNVKYTGYIIDISGYIMFYIFSILGIWFWLFSCGLSVCLSDVWGCSVFMDKIDIFLFFLSVSTCLCVSDDCMFCCFVCLGCMFFLLLSL